ncbi:MAG: hypothetical protein LUI87_18835, partial [Lachnospiraceae bacterium]|nr:hypothetical protein [Lachnospiraceae bacterium]
MKSIMEELKSFGKSCVDLVKQIWYHKQGRVGLIVVLFVIFLAIFAAVRAPYEPYDVTQRADKGLSPCLAH